MDKQKKAKMLKLIGFVCWFLALLMLFDEHQRRKEQEQSGEAGDSTLIFPSED